MIITPLPFFFTEYSGTGRQRLTIAREALSSKRALGDHSILIILEVRTVKRALPQTTIA